MDVKVGRETVKRFNHFPRLTVEELQTIRRTAPEALASLKSFGTPAYLIFDPAREKIGEKMDRGGVNAQKIQEDIAAAAKKVGAGATVEAYRAFHAQLASAKDALEADDFAKAVKAVLALEKMKGLNDAMKRESAAVGTALKEKIEAKVKEIEEYVDPAAIKEDLKKLADAVKGHPMEKGIRDKLK